MPSHRISRRLFHRIAEATIIPRWIFLLSVYGMALIVLALALLYYPLAVVALSLLAGLYVDKRGWIKSRCRAWKENRQGGFGN